MSHDYYATRADFMDLEVVPTATCQQLLRDHGLLFRQSMLGIQILYEEDNTQETSTPLRLLASDQFKLTFLVKVKNKDFYGFSDLPMSFRHPKLFYWSNLVDNARRDDLYLTTNISTGSSETVVYNRSTVNWSGTSEKEAINISIKDIYGDKIVSSKVETEDGSFECQLNLKGYPAGKYEVYEDDTPVSVLYVSDELNTSSLSK